MDLGGGDISGTYPSHFGRLKNNLSCLNLKCSENGKNDMKSKKKKRSFWRSTNFDHLPPCGFGFVNPESTTDCNPSIGSPALPMLLAPPNFQMEITPLSKGGVVLFFFFFFWHVKNLFLLHCVPLYVCRLCINYQDLRTNRLGMAALRILLLTFISHFVIDFLSI